MQNLTNILTYVAFALGFATGNYVGLLIEERIAFGNLIVRIITRKDASELLQQLWQGGYGVTNISGQGESGPVQLIFTVCRRRELATVIQLVRHFNPRAFYTIEDVRYVQDNLPYAPVRRRLLPRLAWRHRK